MTKSELIEILAAKSLDLSHTMRHFSARQGRNPKTGKTVQLLPRSMVHFKPGLEMRERVNNTN